MESLPPGPPTDDPDLRLISLSDEPGPAAGMPSSGTAEQDKWQRLLTQIGEEIAGPLTAALERVHALTTTGKIERRSLRSLRSELEQARRVSMASQQIARYANPALRQSHERLSLTETLQGVLAHRSRETQAQGIEVRQVLKPVDVVADPSLLFGLLNTLLDWAMAHTRSFIEFRLDTKTWPAHGRVTCRFRHTPADVAEAWAYIASMSMDPAALLDDVSWRLLEQTAETMGLVAVRQRDDSLVTLTLEFPHTVGGEIPGLSIRELEGDAPASPGKGQPLAGSHVLVIASRRDVRIQVREAIRHMGLVVDFVNSIEEAAAFCREGLPHAIVIESILRGERFNQLRAELTEEVEDLVFVEIIEEGAVFEVSGFGGRSMARVGRDAILSSLPSALVFELTKGL